MKNVSDITACFVDHQGLYLPIAQKLSQSYKRIIYYDPCERAFPRVNDIVIGDGYEKIERVDTFWDQKGDIDLFVFPDSQGASLQLELASQGFPVWGSRYAEVLEMSREEFHKVLGDVGLDVPTFQTVTGITALRHHLRDKTDKYIKISRFRGSLETFHWRSWPDDALMIDQLAVKFGGVGELIPFLVFDEIPTDIEIGGDTYCIRGEWPDAMLDGFEWKDKGYFGALKDRSDMPEQTRAVMDAFGPILKRYRHANFWSMEIRVKGDKFYFIDPTPRGPLPGSGSQCEMYLNLAEIVASGADGQLVNPEPAANFSAECVLTVKREKPLWASMEVPKALNQWVKLSGSCLIDGRNWFPYDESHGEEIGWLVAIGDTPAETIETMLDHAAQLPDGIEANTESLVNLLKEIHKSEQEGIEFTPAEVPEPAIVVEEKQ